MRSAWSVLCFFALLGTPDLRAQSEQSLRDLLRRDTGTVTLPAGAVQLHREIAIPASAHDLKINATGAVIDIAPDFTGRSAITIEGGRHIEIAGLAFRAANVKRAVIALAAANVDGLDIRDVTVTDSAGPAIAVAASGHIQIRAANITDTAGGILLEDVHDFTVENCRMRHIVSPGILVRAVKAGPNREGRISGNRFTTMARSAIQVSAISRIAIDDNSGSQIGYPVGAVNERVIPAAIRTAGDVDAGSIRGNAFEEVNGNCLGLDGFHDGEVQGNSCTNRELPDAYPNGNYGIVMHGLTRNVRILDNRLEGFLYGAVLLQGSGNRVSGNHFLRLNLAHCNDTPGCLQTAAEPDLLRSGIYLQGSATRNNSVERNEINGFGMTSRCVTVGPGVIPGANQIGPNQCSDEAAIEARLVTPR